MIIQEKCSGTGERKNSTTSGLWKAAKTSAIHKERQEHQGSTNTRFAIDAIRFMSNQVNDSPDPKKSVNIDYEVMFDKIDPYLKNFYGSSKGLALGEVSPIIYPEKVHHENQAKGMRHIADARRISEKSKLDPSGCLKQLLALSDRTTEARKSQAISKCQKFLEGEPTQGLSQEEKHTLISDPSFQQIAMDPKNGLDEYLTASEDESFVAKAKVIPKESESTEGLATNDASAKEESDSEDKNPMHGANL